MTIASLALVASLAATADPIGGTKAAPLAVPLDGSAKGFQATRTTRWLRFKSSDCRWITLSGEFSRGDSNTVVLEHVKNELPVGAGGNDDFGPVIFETNNDTLDVGISVRKYTDVALTWTSAPCVTPKPTPSTKALADALTGWTSVPTAAQLTEKLAGAGFVAGDGDWWTAAIDGVTVTMITTAGPRCWSRSSARSGTPRSCIAAAWNAIGAPPARS